MNATYTPSEDNEKCLEKYGTDLTALAKSGKLDPVIGRDTEIRDIKKGTLPKSCEGTLPKSRSECYKNVTQM